MSTYNPQNRPMMTITDPNYVRCGQSGYVGNDFGTHVTLHFPDGSAENFHADGIAPKA